MRVRLFKPQFAPMVLNGTKRQTIRPTPKRLPQPGDLESWRQWTGLPYRSKQRELVQVRIKEVQRIVIRDGGMVLADKFLSVPEIVKIATADGFLGWPDFLGWFNFTHGLPFTGILIKAEDL